MTGGFELSRQAAGDACAVLDAGGGAEVVLTVLTGVDGAGCALSESLHTVLVIAGNIIAGVLAEIDVALQLAFFQLAFYIDATASILADTRFVADGHGGLPISAFNINAAAIATGRCISRDAAVAC